MKAVAELVDAIGVSAACEALGVNRATYYRFKKEEESEQKTGDVYPRERRVSPRALSLAERQKVLELLHSERFMDAAPREVYAALLEEGQYLCSVRTMYRVLKIADEVVERRAQRKHPV